MTVEAWFVAAFAFLSGALVGEWWMWFDGWRREGGEGTP